MASTPTAWHISDGNVHRLALEPFGLKQLTGNGVIGQVQSLETKILAKSKLTIRKPRFVENVEVDVFQKVCNFQHYGLATWVISILSSTECIFTQSGTKRASNPETF